MGLAVVERRRAFALRPAQSAVLRLGYPHFEAKVTVTYLVLVEALGLVACCVGIWFTMQARGRLTADGRLTLLVIFALVGAVHFLDVLEWSGSSSADRLGDIIKVFTPAAWLFFLFVVRRDGLLTQVAEQNQQLDFFFEQAPMAVAVLDQNERYLACSQRWLELHQMRRSPVGLRIMEHATPYSDLWATIVHESKRKSAPHMGTERFELSLGDRWIEWKARPFQREEGIYGTILIVDDVTERVLEEQQRELTQQRLMQQQNMETMGEIATGVAHDVNNMLQVISAHAAALEEERLDEEELRDSFRSIRNAIGSASGMTRWLLRYGRRSDASFERVNLGDLLSQVSQILQRAIPHNQRLVVKLPAKATEVLGDQTLLEQLIINLVLNARDAMLKGGELSVLLVHEEGKAILKVQDQGTGIEEGLRETIMEPFFTTKGDNGTGMGLAVVRRVVREHGAELEIASELGRGSCFTIRFPDPEVFEPHQVDSERGAFSETRRLLRELG